MDGYDRVIVLRQRLLGAMPPDDPNRAIELFHLGKSFGDRFDTSFNLNDLEEAIECIEHAIDISPAGDINFPKFLRFLGVRYYHRFQQLDEITDLQQAIQLTRRSLDMSLDLELSLIYLQYLALMLEDRFQRLGDVTDLEVALQYTQRAFDLVSVEDQHYPDYLNLLIQRLGSGMLQHSRLFQRTGELPVLEKGIEYGQTAINAIPDTHPVHSINLHFLGRMLHDRFDKLGQMDDIMQAIQYAQDAINLSPDDHPSRFLFLNSLSLNYKSLFDKTGQEIHLNKAVKIALDVVNTTPEDKVAAAVYQHNISGFLYLRYLRTNEGVDLEQAVEYGRRGAVNLPDDYPNRSIYVKEYGLLLLSRYRRTGHSEDVETALRYGKAALHDLPASSPDYPSLLDYLARVYSGRYDQLHRSEDIEQAIQLFGQATDALPSDHHQLPSYLYRLARALYDRFVYHDQIIDDLHRGIKYINDALSVTTDQTLRGLFLTGLSGLYETLFTSFGDVHDLESSIEALEEAGSYNDTNYLIRVCIQYWIAQRYKRMKKWDEAAKAFDLAIDLLPKITRPTHSRTDLQYMIENFHGLGSLIVSVFLKCKRSPAQILLALEKCRGIILSFLMDTRTEEAALQEANPSLWNRHTQCQDNIKLHYVIRKAFLKGSLQSSFTKYATSNELLLKFHDELDDIRTEIRGLPGFEGFRLSPTEREILDLAGTGAIVSFNLSDVSCEALLVFRQSIEIIPLPELDEVKVRRCIEFLASFHTTNRRDGAIVCDHEDYEVVGFPAPEATGLEYLWTSAVKPVLLSLGLLGSKTRADKLPRIWWVGGGIMALAPIHAAGDHSPRSTENTLSHAISSYAPTLNALHIVQKRPKISMPHLEKLTVVSMPTTPGYLALDTREEVKTIEEHAAQWANVEVLEHPRKDEVMNALKTSGIVHCACHGVADSEEPAESALLVGKDECERLTIHDLDAIPYKNAYMVYLSACSTAQMRSRRLFDESIHVASAFQIIGFQHVIGSLWPVTDEAAVNISGNFYRGLFAGAK